jgi:hypothetical protein
MDPIFETLSEITAPVKWYNRVRDEKPLAPLAEQFKLKYTPSNTTYMHGTGWNDCEICNNEITDENPGKRVTLEADGQKRICHVCCDCFNDPDYQDIIKRYPIIQIENYL